MSLLSMYLLLCRCSRISTYADLEQSILRLSDLSTISAKKIRRALAQEFPNDEIAQNKVCCQLWGNISYEKSILDKRILDCFSVIRKEREGSSDEEESKPLARPVQDLLKSDLMHPSSPAPKRKLGSSPPSASPLPVAKKPRASPPVPRAKPKPVAVKEPYDSDEDAKFAAELDMALNSTGRRTRGAAAGTRTKSRPKKKAAKNGEEGEKKKRAPNPNNAFHAPMLLSPQLSEVVFESELSRPVS
jgi:upstream activation factor subunit UAF30